MARELASYAHPEYMQNLVDWTQIRDCYKGARAIKSKTEIYLPRLTGQSELDYRNYLTRALFFPITGKTVSTLVGMATGRPPKTSAPDTMSKYFSDTEDPAFQFTEFYVAIFTEVLLQGRYGMLIDAPVGGGDPVFASYIAENIVNWQVDSRQRYTMLLLREQVEERKDEFGVEIECRYRHCYVKDDVYFQQLLDDDLQPVGPVIMPLFSGQAIDYIPFVVVGASGVHASCDKPPMLDISTINVSHYMTSADLEWGRHIVGLPTPVVTGVDAGSKLSIGGTAAWVLPPPDAKAFYLEFQGQGLQSLEKAMQDKIGLMASMSARLVDTNTKGSEAAETVRLRYMSETASLIHIIGSVENALVLLYSILATLRRESKVTIDFTKEILGATITFRDIAVLFEAYLNSSISKETLVYNLRRLDAIDPNRTDAEELAAIKEPPPKTAGNPAGSRPQPQN